MFRDMRRNRQKLPEEESIAILKHASHGVLAVQGDDGYPYTIPLSFLYLDNHIYIHCAKSGHKNDAILKNEKVSFCVVDSDHVIPDRFTTYYRSVILFGRASFMEDGPEKHAAALRLALKYSPGNSERCEAELEKTKDRMDLIDIRIEHLSGKESIEYAKERKAISEI